MNCHVNGCPLPVRFRISVREVADGNEEILTLYSCENHREIVHKQARRVSIALGRKSSVHVETVEPDKTNGWS